MHFFFISSYHVNNRCDYYYRSSAKSGDRAHIIYILLDALTRDYLSDLFLFHFFLRFQVSTHRKRYYCYILIRHISKIMLCCALLKYENIYKHYNATKLLLFNIVFRRYDTHHYDTIISLLYNKHHNV